MARRKRNQRDRVEGPRIPLSALRAERSRAPGKRDAALAELRGAEARHPHDLEILGALVSMNREAGDAKAALSYARKLAEVLPDEPGVKGMMAELHWMQR